MRVRNEACTNTQDCKRFDLNVRCGGCCICFIQGYLFMPRTHVRHCLYSPSSDTNWRATANYSASEVSTSWPGCCSPHSRPNIPQDLLLRSHQKYEIHPEYMAMKQKERLALRVFSLNRLPCQQGKTLIENLKTTMLYAMMVFKRCRSHLELLHVMFLDSGHTIICYDQWAADTPSIWCNMDAMLLTLLHKLAHR